MAALLTTAGTAHLASLNAGTAPANAFDGILFGQGNDDPATPGTETQADVTSQLADVYRQVADGYPLQDDSDPRNTAAASDWWTWKFVLPAGQPFVASNVALTNYAGGTFTGATDLAIHSDQVVAQRYDEKLVVWFNAKTGEVPVVVTAAEQSLENRITRAVGFTARTRALSSHPAGSAVDDTTVRTKPQPDQQVWTAAHVYGIGSQALRSDQIGTFILDVEEYDPTRKQYQQVDSIGIDPTINVFPVDQYGDQRWTAQGGYNVAHTWTPPYGGQEGTYRLTYKMELTDQDVRRWTNIVEVRRGRS